MSWIEPKTDWQSTDYINISDYNRIVGNINYIYDLSTSLYSMPSSTTLTTMTSYNQIPYVDNFNSIGTKLVTINKTTYNIPIKIKTQYDINGYAWDYVELNRIESLTKRIYDELVSERSTLSRLAFMLPGNTGIIM